MIKIRTAFLFIALSSAMSVGIGYILGMSAVNHQFVNANLSSAVIEMSNVPPATPPTLQQPEPE